MIAVVVGWTRRNLFATPLDAFLSLGIIPLCAWTIYAGASWAINLAQWAIIPDSLRVLMIGIYPEDQIWRIWGALFVFCLLVGAALGQISSLYISTALTLYLATVLTALIGSHLGAPASLLFCVCAALLFGGWHATGCIGNLRRFVLPAWGFGLIAIFTLISPPGVGLWGGLLLSLLVTLVTSVLSLPLGILLAFGRRSRFASVRMACTAYIEVMRSVPLILVVYCVWIVLPVLAPQYSVPDVLRGMAGFTAFFCAYVAEYVRSGLQAVPKGQSEAARSLGMSEIDINRYIILPQAIRVVIPALVGNVLDVFNAAPLVFIIGLTDFLRAGQMILANPQYSNRIYEVYGFLFVVYFLIGSLLTFAARKLEQHLARNK